MPVVFPVPTLITGLLDDQYNGMWLVVSARPGVHANSV